jgi:hypothetical protein
LLWLLVSPPLLRLVPLAGALINNPTRNDYPSSHHQMKYPSPQRNRLMPPLPPLPCSGIVEVKSTLNGIKRRDWLTLKTMVIKVAGLICGTSASMPIGKEGPMVHVGAAIGAGLPQVRPSVTSGLI